MIHMGEQFKHMGDFFILPARFVTSLGLKRDNAH
jgi:hypothetical protein